MKYLWSDQVILRLNVIRIVSYYCLLLSVFASIPRTLISQTLQDENLVVIAVLDILPRNVSADETAVITEMVRHELLKTGVYKLVEKQRLKDVVAEQTFQQLGLTQEALAVQLGQLLNVEKVFLGTLGMIDDRRFFALRIVNVETGQVEASAMERGFTVKEFDQVVISAVRVLRNLPPLERSVTAWDAGSTKSERYLIVYAGPNVGNIKEFHAESIFRSGPNAPEPIWQSYAPEAKSKYSFPGFGLKFGTWKRWYGGDFQISILSHHVPPQTIPYDNEGFIFIPDSTIIPEGGVYFPVKISELTIPNNFLKMFSLGFGGIFYVQMPFNTFLPYAGIGISLLMNKATSDYPGPGSHALQIDGDPLNSTSLGWALHLPIGAKLKISNNKLLFMEFRFSRHYFSYVSSSGFQREKDKFILETFQFLIGTGWIFR